jgi:uncharacterized OB-fold protein
MLWACAKCMALYSVGAPACPQCGSTEYREAPGGGVEDDAPVLNSAPTPEPAATPAKAKATDAGTTAAAS